ncbi:MAG: plastocyanin/azurin family copper-binding protein [Acidimicrobiia bacterium]
MSGETVLLRSLAAVAVLSLLVVACGSPSGSATTTTGSSADSSTVADQSTLETVRPSSSSQSTNPPISASTTSGSTTTVKPTTTTTVKPTTTTTAQTLKTVAGSIVAFAFNPNPININVGDTVRWTNNDPVDHTTTSLGNWNSGSLTSGASFSEVFESPGTFNYFCSIHPSMTATVVVNP